MPPSITTLLLDDGENFVECSALAETWLTWNGQVTEWRAGRLPFCPASVIHAPLLDRTQVAGAETHFAVSPVCAVFMAVYVPPSVTAGLNGRNVHTLCMHNVLCEKCC